MSIRTKSEEIFESFLKANGIRFNIIEEAETRRPDFQVYVGDSQIIFEVKELAEDKDFGVAIDSENPDSGTSWSGVVGSHIGRRIDGSRRQIQYGAKQGIPSVLLIYNNLDTVFQMAYTSDHDFTAAMYGELTVLVDKSSGIVASELFHGRNGLLRRDKNRSFSAVGRLCDRGGKTTVDLFENVFAAYKLPFAEMPPCLHVVRVEIDDSPMAGYTTLRPEPVQPYVYQPYPKWLYHPQFARQGQLFQSAEETAGLEEAGWVDTPTKFSN